MSPNPNPNNTPKNPNPNFRPKSKPVSSRYLLSPATSSSSSVSLSSTSSSSSLTLTTPPKTEKFHNTPNNNAKSRSFSTPRLRDNGGVFSNLNDFGLNNRDFGLNLVEKSYLTPKSSKSRSISTPKQRDNVISNRKDFVSNKRDLVSNSRDFSSNKCDFGTNSRDLSSNKRDVKVTGSRSLSVSFQGEAFSLPVSKTRVPVTTGSVFRRETPASGRRWPARIRQLNPNLEIPKITSFDSIVVDNSNNNNYNNNNNNNNNNINSCNVVGSGSDLNQNGDKLGIMEQNDKLGVKFVENLGILEENEIMGVIGRNEKIDISKNEKFGVQFDEKMSSSVNRKFSIESNENSRFLKCNCSSNSSDSDSVSSGSTNSCRNSTKFWNLPKYPLKINVPPKFGQPKKFPIENFSTSNVSQRTISNSSPMRNSIRASSPNGSIRGSIDRAISSCSRAIRGSLDRAVSSPSRGMRGSIDRAISSRSRGMRESIDRAISSPSRVRSLISSGFVEMPSVLSFAVDVKRGRVGENQIVDAHSLRLLYNRYLQWRFVNARKESVLLAHKRSVERNMWNAWVTISKLRESVTRKTYRLHLLKQKLKLASILKGQITDLEDWYSLDNGHCMSLLGSIEALKGSTLRLPVVGGAIANLHNIEDAIGSAVDVMQAMDSSICSVLFKVEELNSLVSELAKEIEKEKVLLAQCKAGFTKMAALQVKYCSLRTHILQDNSTYH